MEAAPGFEPRIKELQSSALPLGYAALQCYSIVYSRGIKILPYFFEKKENFLGGVWKFSKGEIELNLCSYNYNMYKFRICYTFFEKLLFFYKFWA